MKLYVNVKQAGSRKKYITKEVIELASIPLSLRELIEAIVTKNVKEFNNNLKDKKIVDYLTHEDIENKLTQGKVSFGEIHNQAGQSLDRALEAAYLAYIDGIYRVFVGNEETRGLDDALQLNDGDVLTFIKLTMLAGRMW